MSVADLVSTVSAFSLKVLKLITSPYAVPFELVAYAL